MRYIIMVKANAETEAAAKFDPQVMEDMERFHEELSAAGVLVDGIGRASCRERVSFLV